LSELQEQEALQETVDPEEILHLVARQSWPKEEQVDFRTKMAGLLALDRQAMELATPYTPAVAVQTEEQ